MIVYYRISDVGYNKEKLPSVNNENCLRNFCNIFRQYINNVHIIADNISDDTYSMIIKYVHPDNVYRVSVGHGAGTFNLALDMALKRSDDTIVYFVENDYIHRKEADKVLIEGFGIGAEFITLYDHLDKYFDGPNPYVYQGGEDTKVFLTTTCHWKFTNSTTMTFAGKVASLRRYEAIIRKYTSTSHPYDFDMWIALRGEGASLISPIPGYSTHGDLPTIAPLIDWENELQKN